MTNKGVAFAKRQGKRFELRGYPRTLGRLFPQDNAHSPAMWRLAIIRDDLDRELDGIGIPDDDEERFWELGYFVRRIAISVLEAKSIFDHDVPAMLKDEMPALNMGFLKARVSELQEKLEEAEKLVLPIRDALGGHVRPNNANPDRNSTESYDLRGLRTLASYEGVVTLSRTAVMGTSYRDFTKMALLFAWPDVTDGASLEAKLKEFEPLVAGSTALAAGIDGVLYAFWVNIGAMEPGR